MAIAGTSPRPRAHVRDGITLMCAGVAGWGAAPLFAHPGLAWPALAIGTTTGAAAITVGQRAARRSELVTSLMEHLAPLLGAGTRPRHLVQAKGWTRGWPGCPRRVLVHYGVGRTRLNPDPSGSVVAALATVDLGDGRWVAEINRQVSRRLGGDYKVQRHDQIRRRLVLRLRPAPDPSTEQTESPQVSRAKKLVGELLAGTATIEKIEVDEHTGEVRRLEVRHDVGAKLVAPGYRNRVERTLSVMLPGRWRAKWDMEGDAVIFEVRPTLPESLWIPPLELPDSDPLTNYRQVQIPYGVDEDGEVIAWRPAINPQWLITGSTGSGKRLALSTPVPTPGGWVTMGDLAEGDRVFGRDGRPCRVETLWPVETTPELYRVTFSDGQSVLADQEHQWLVSTASTRQALRSRGRRGALDRHRWARALVEQLEQLAANSPDDEMTLRQILDLLTAFEPDLPWSTHLGLRAALDAVDCPFRIETRTISRTTGDFARPVRIYNTPTALKALALRIAEQHHTPPSTDVAEVRMTTQEMLAAGVRVAAAGRANFAVRVTAAVEMPEADLPIDPYVLGAWLGDGTASSGGFTSLDPEVLTEIRAAGFHVHSHPHLSKEHYIRGLLPSLRQVGVLGNKHLPDQYLRASVRQRLALLQGLMDTDGTVDKNGACEISLSDPHLADQTLDLVRSLGIKASLRAAPSSYLSPAGHLVKCQDRNRIHFTTTRRVFRLARKLDRLPTTIRDTSRWLYVTSIERAPAEPARCITVDSADRTYLCGRGYVPTSNTSTGHGILTQITQFGWPVWVADGKGIEFLGFQDWPNVQIIASCIEEQVAVIHRAWQLMEHRYQLVVQRRARTDDFEPLMVFVDEFTDLKANLLAWYTAIKVKGDPTKPVTLAEIGSIARKGRTARVHLVLSMQRPDAEIIQGETRENFGQRTSMGPLSPQGAEMMWNSPVIGVTIPRGRTGRAIGTNDLGAPVEMQAYRVPDPKDCAPGTPEGELIERLRPKDARHERLLIVSPATASDGDESGGPTFSDYAKAAWVKAVDRPDLDPLAQEHHCGEGTDGTSLGSPSALFGFAGFTGSRLRKPGRGVDGSGTTAGAKRMPIVLAAPGVEHDADTYGDGYGPATGARVSSLVVGDLIRVDDDLDAWAVVEEEPIEDFDDSGLLVISWRDDQDGSGQLCVPADAAIQARRPI